MIDPSLTLQMQTAVDTVVAAVPRDPLAVATDVAVLVMAVGVSVLSVLGIIVLRRVDRAARAIRRRVIQSLVPVSDRARSIAANVEFITEALRTDVHRLHGSIESLSDRLNQASDRMEERIEEFNALMEVVQGEAEGIFLDTAATVRGVREGAKAMPGALGASSQDASPEDVFPEETVPGKAAPGPTAPGNMPSGEVPGEKASPGEEKESGAAGDP